MKKEENKSEISERMDEWLKENGYEVVARNRKSGKEYVYCEKTKNGNFYSVLTKRAAYLYSPKATWIVNAEQVILSPTPLNK